MPTEIPPVNDDEFNQMVSERQPMTRSELTFQQRAYNLTITGAMVRIMI